MDLVDGDGGAARLAKKVEIDGSIPALSAVSAHEYLFGIHHKYGRSKRRLREKLVSARSELGGFEILPLTREIAETTSKIHADLAGKGETIGINDIYIAGTALHHNLKLVTRDKAHFERVPRLDIEEC